MNLTGLSDLPALVEGLQLSPQSHGTFTLRLSPVDLGHKEQVFRSPAPAEFPAGDHRQRPAWGCTISEAPEQASLA